MSTKEKIAIFAPSKLTIEILKKRKDVYIFKDHKWFTNDESGLKELKNKFSYDSIKNFSVSTLEILKALEYWHPLLDRWVVGTWHHRMIKQRLIPHIHEIMFNLKKLNIGKVIFHTAVTHHLDTLVMSLSCELLNIKQIYLVGQNIDGDIIPIEQKQNVFSRKLLNIKLSKRDKKNEIHRLENRIINKEKPLGTRRRSLFSKSFWFAILNLFFLKSIYVIYNYFKKNKFLNNLQNETLDLNSFSFFGYISILNRQKQFIKAYKKNIINLSDELKSDDLQKNFSILLMAHYQPEATTFPLGGYFDSAHTIISTLREKGFHNKIFYREHPSTFFFADIDRGVSQAGMYRDIEFIKIIKNYGCNLISPDENLTDDVWKKVMPLTTGGSIAVERAVKGYPTLTMGEPWFKNMPGIIHINNIKNLDKLDPKWFESNLEIKRDALSWLEENLSYKSIKNCPGISFGFKNKIPDHDQKSLEIFEEELNNLIRLI